MDQKGGRRFISVKPAEKVTHGAINGRQRRGLQKNVPQLTELAETISRQANATAIFGSPGIDGDRTVVPVAEARFALGVGDGLIAKGLGGA
jgi:hypothetical protein